jgi:tRNA threonylcarbamoyladenosine biosynthesis protein TsaE
MTSESITIWLPNAQKTQEFGASLAHTLYAFPLTILLDGELGAGKTTFLQGLARGLGIEGHLTSPTFALEQRYRLPRKTPSAHVAEPKGSEFLHLDLYRLDTAQAKALLRSTEGFEGIRCIEWAGRVPEHAWDGPVIRIRLMEDGNGRRADVLFEDIAIPTEEEVDAWRKDVLLPSHIVAHCETVAKACDILASALLAKGIAVRPLALRRAAQLHDLLRFIDFRAKAGPAGIVHTPAEERRWSDVRATYGPTHEEGCVQWLRERGYPAIAEIVRTHGLKPDALDRQHTEEHLLFYADKRAMVDRIVSIQERFQDFADRYGNGVASEQSTLWLAETKAIEMLLFPEGMPL